MYGTLFQSVICECGHTMVLERRPHEAVENGVRLHLACPNNNFGQLFAPPRVKLEEITILHG